MKNRGNQILLEPIPTNTIRALHIVMIGWRAISKFKTKSISTLPRGFVPIFTPYHERIPTSTETKSFQSRELAVMGSFFFCEICNSVCEYGDPVWLEHQEELKFHKIKRMLLLRCANCGTVVVDAFAEFSLERNEFWCRNCIEKIGYVTFRSAT